MIVLCIGGVILLSVVVQMARVSEDHGWKPDYALYLLHTRNLVEGIPYADTPYLTNPVNGNPSPRAYPPGFPILLAPVYAAFDGAMIPMKVYIIFLFAASLALVACLLNRELSPPFLVAVIAILGLNPYLVDFTSYVLSDLPFLFVMVLTVAAWRTASEGQTRTMRLGFGLAAGVLAYYCILVRSLGILVPSSLALYDLLVRRRLTSTTVTTLAVVAAAYVTHSLVSVTTGGAVASAGIEEYSELVRLGLLDRMSALLMTLVTSIESYAEWLGQIVLDPRPVPDTMLSNYIVKGSFMLFSMVVLAGWAHHAWVRPAVYDVLTAVFILALLPWNFGTPRYLIPVIPFCVFYAVYLVDLLTTRSHRFRKPLLTSASLVLCAIYIWRLSHIPIPGGVYSPEARRVYEQIRTTTAPDDIIVTGRPRVVAYETRRRSVSWFTERPDAELLDWLDHIGADHVVLILDEQTLSTRSKQMIGLVSAYPERFEPTFETEHYRIYRIRRTD